MGVAFHELKFLTMVASRRGLGEVLTIARQDLNVSPRDLAKQYGGQLKLDSDRYIDDLLVARMGASKVSSIDNSSYEGATFVADLNETVDLQQKFDTIIDFGTLEHVFDIGTALKNLISLCRSGGRILHSLPSNSECGHGFYQFSPELFFSLYSERNGFKNTTVYIADLMNESSWYLVTPPSDGRRAMANSLSATYILCVTEKVTDVEMLSVQQSDYVQAWQEGASIKRGQSAIKDAMRRLLKGSFLAAPATLLYRSLFAGTGLTRANAHLRKVSITSQIG